MPSVQAYESSLPLWLMRGPWYPGRIAELRVRQNLPIAVCAKLCFCVVPDGTIFMAAELRLLG